MTGADLFSAILVGALWGCTNPLLRRGSAGAKKESKAKDETQEAKAGESAAAAARDETAGSGGGTAGTGGAIKSAALNLLSYRRLPVLLPYLLNQCGSILFYKLLATSDLTVSVPVCNALALVFSVVTSYVLGERVDCPWRAALGSALVTAGVAVCAMASSSSGGGVDEGGEADGSGSSSATSSEL